MKKIVCLLSAFWLAIMLCACAQEPDDDAEVYQIYAVSSSETKVEMHPHKMRTTGNEEMLDELVEALSTPPEKLEYKVPFAMGFEVLSMKLKDSRLLLDVSAAYLDMPVTTEVLVRAAIVRTLTQLPNVNADMFIDNDGNEINTYEKVRVKLYFANMSGDKLIGAYREKYYSTNMPLERFVVEELIAGPSGKVEGLYPTINPETKVVGVTTQDGVCYVNLDSGFLTPVNNVSAEDAIYSIVNSLAELSSVNKVQILVNGEVPASFSQSVYERNLDYVTTLDN